MTCRRVGSGAVGAADVGIRTGSSGANHVIASVVDRWTSRKAGDWTASSTMSMWWVGGSVAASTAMGRGSGVRAFDTAPGGNGVDGGVRKGRRCTGMAGGAAARPVSGGRVGVRGGGATSVRGGSAVARWTAGLGGGED
ncbi:hypothetical protein E4P42_01520, partial [Mycobacterium sp. PS03-16]